MKWKENSFKTVLKVFSFSFIALCRQSYIYCLSILWNTARPPFRLKFV